MNIEATPQVYPRSDIPKIQTTVLTNMYGHGHLLPKRDVELSVNTPMAGCIRRPERGPARNTMVVEDFERPSERSQGDA